MDPPAEILNTECGASHTTQTLKAPVCTWLEQIAPGTGGARYSAHRNHHVHHKLFTYNYGHLFSYWDRVCGTYRHPQNVRQFRDNGKAPTRWKPHARTKI